MSNAIVIGSNSGIGDAISVALLERRWSVTGTIRGSSKKNLGQRSHLIEHCDLSDTASVDETLSRLKELANPWDALIVAPGTLEPIGPFSRNDFDQWVVSLEVNFINQIKIVHGLLPQARKIRGLIEPIVIFFAGGGSNSAPTSFSAYTISKIALTKMTEILDAECPNIRFCIIGPGWVHTKIHNQALKNPNTPIEVREETERRLKTDDFVKTSEVVDAVLWSLSAPKDVIGGRNISVKHDPFRAAAFAAGLSKNADLLKLRRNGNDYAWMEKL